MKNKESEINKLREECAALRRGFDTVRQMQEAMGSVVQLLARESITDRDQCIEMAKAIDALASQTELFDKHDLGVPWLRTLRDEYVFRHGFIPVAEQLFAEGKIGGQIQPPPRLSVLPGGHQSHPESSATPGADSASPAADPA